MESTKPYSKLSTEELNRLVSVHADFEQQVLQLSHYQLVDVLKRYLTSICDLVSTEMSEREEQRFREEGQEGEEGGGDAIEGLSWAEASWPMGSWWGLPNPDKWWQGSRATRIDALLHDF